MIFQPTSKFVCGICGTTYADSANSGICPKCHPAALDHYMRNCNYSGGSGGVNTVYVRYKTKDYEQAGLRGAGGVVSQCGEYTIHALVNDDGFSTEKIISDSTFRRVLNVVKRFVRGVLMKFRREN